jgi:hypothetical protein
MVSGLHKFLFLVILGAVLLVFIAPSVDLPDTVLNTQQSLYYVMLCIAVLISMRLLRMAQIFHLCEKEAPPVGPTSSLAPLLCVFRC